MTATAAAAQKLHLSRRAPRARTGGPHDDDEGPKILEHVLGWTLVVVLALFVTGAGLM
ncbi:SCO1431 family membrane protein [Streptomyces sp. AM 2-1-1]|uniref:SCO1431 family membrane protein n=1 Tax=unclassified Streptomyces TaxID=2593676 RepID=UPI0023B96DEA|nr:SCO1431 family membrane protein [Streptomyces sp. AM 2-1-1]WEH42886.1 SCO1431 family membrane protein [Streptomyces sp. AM 2-1-1]